jgi:hypothetical protein
VSPIPELVMVTTRPKRGTGAIFASYPSLSAEQDVASGTTLAPVVVVPVAHISKVWRSRRLRA